MKRLLTILLITLPILAWSQAPEGMNYQAVARDGAGEPLQNQAITVVFEIRQGSANGTDVYKESQALSTNQFGLFTAEIGSGTVLGGAFNTISWGTNSYYLYVEIDGDPMGTSQLLSVPYALYSKQSANGPTGPQGPPGVSINWLGTFATAPGTPALNDAYYDSTLGQSFIWDGASWNIIAQDGTAGAFTAGPGISIITGVISNTGDLDSTNELQTISRSGGLITLSNGGGSVIDSVIDADADPNNERITTFALNSTSDSLIIVEAGVGHAFPLSQLNDGDWTRGTGSDIFNAIDSVGIGTNNPKSPLQIGNWVHHFPFTMPGPEQYSVMSYNAHPNGGTIRNTNGGYSGINFIGHDNTDPNWGVQLYPTLAAGGDIMATSPISFMHLKPIGLGIHQNSPQAALDIEPKDTAAVVLRPAISGSPSHLFFEDTQNFWIGLRSPNVTTGSYALTLPTSLPAITGSALVSDLAGNLSWAPSPAPIWSKGGSAVFLSANGDHVGLGTSTPTARLELFGTTNIATQFRSVRSAGATATFGAEQFNATVGTNSNHPLYFRVNALDRMALNQSGWLGLNTVSPLVGLHIFGSETATTLNANGGSPATTFRIHNNDQTANNFSSLSFTSQLSNNGTAEFGKIAIQHVNHTAGSQLGDMVFFTRNSSNLNERMRINGNGDVGVGTSTPANRLDVEGAMAVGAGYSGTSSAGANSLIVEGTVGIGTTSPDQAPFEIFKPNGYMAFTCTSNSTPYGVRLSHPHASISPVASWFLLVNPAGSNVQDFSIFKGSGPNSGFQMYFNEGNQIGVFTNAPTNSFSVNGSANKTGGGTWGVFSDRNLKKQVTNYEEGLDLILKVNPVNFQYNETYFTLFGESKEVRNRTYQGVIAQDLEKIAPDMVRSHHVVGQDTEGNVTGEQDILEVDPNKFTYALINAVKEQQKLIDALIKKQKELEEEIKNLKNQ